MTSLHSTSESTSEHLGPAPQSTSLHPSLFSISEPRPQQSSRLASSRLAGPGLAWPCLPRSEMTADVGRDVSLHHFDKSPLANRPLLARLAGHDGPSAQRTKVSHAVSPTSAIPARVLHATRVKKCRTAILKTLYPPSPPHRSPATSRSFAKASLARYQDRIRAGRALGGKASTRSSFNLRRSLGATTPSRPPMGCFWLMAEIVSLQSRRTPIQSGPQLRLPGTGGVNPLRPVAAPRWHQDGLPSHHFRSVF